VKQIFVTLFAVAVSVLLLLGLLLSHVYYAAPRTNPATVEVRVEQGDSLATVVGKLREQQVIMNERLFLLWARLRGVEKKIHRGLYRFEAQLAPHEILERLVMGKGVFHIATVPEGLTVKEIADLLDKLQIVERDKFLAEASDPEFLKLFGLEDKGIEGYLFPSTYHFTPATSEKDILIAMVSQFRKLFEPLLERGGERGRLTPHQIVTLASIIEKETGVEAERPLVSAVFHNRLKLNMPLQSDPTVIYGLKDFNGNLTRKDLNTPSPYNTYRIAALPPGPISNPGLSSIKAALHPADVPFLYFVSKNDGTHLFSESFAAHNRAVKTYQQSGERNPARRKAVALRE